jgi:hypothetical protein
MTFWVKPAPFFDPGTHPFGMKGVAMITDHVRLDRTGVAFNSGIFARDSRQRALAEGSKFGR